MCAATGLLAGAAEAVGNATYTASQTIPVPPASSYGGSGGGDGWALAVGSTQVFNVFHHAGQLTVACHKQSDASDCWDPRTVTDASGAQFGASGHPGMWLDQSTNKLYVYTTSAADSSAGVVCVDTVAAATTPNPFCGYTRLVAAGDGPLDGGISDVSEPVVVGSKWYAFNYVTGAPAGGSKNSLMCFDLHTLAACGSQPFAVPLGAGNVNDSSFPEPQVAAIGGRVIVAATVGSSDVLGCFEVATSAGCTGSWPIALNLNYPSNYGAPFPLLDGTGAVQGFCLPTGVDPCFDFTGAVAPTPAGLAATVGGSDGWNGAAIVLGPRIYVPNGNIDMVQCYSYATHASCPNFPKSFNGLGYLYTVNPDPARPTCLWVNADNGGQQIQNFDAYTGGACGQGPIRVLASSFVVPTQACQPATYTSLQVSEPARASYSTGSVAFQDGDANQIGGVSDADLDATGTATLTGKNLSTALGLPQFLITLNGATQAVGEVKVTLVWTGVNDPSCAKPGTVVTPEGPGGSADCGDAVFLAVPGNGEHYRSAGNLFVSRELKAVYDRLKASVGAKKVSVRVVDFSAPSADALTAGLDKIKSTSPADYLTKAKAKSVSNLGRYLAGKDQGVATLAANFADVRATCSANTKIVIAGYSQGAAVVHEFLNQLAAGSDTAGRNAVVAAALIADPERVATSAPHELADAPAGSSGVCAVLASVASCTTPGPLADLAAPFAARTFSVCSVNDLVCDTSEVATSLQGSYASASGLRAVLQAAKRVHGAYQALPATGQAGQQIGPLVA